MIREAIVNLVEGQSLRLEEAAQVMEEIMTGAATPAQIGAFATALRLKGETVDEIAGLASVMRARATPVRTLREVVDTCGTGGDASGTFNISTAAAFVASGAGVTVAKHGNRAMSSRCGSADVLEALGVNINLNADGVSRCLDEVGVGFMFAPLFHPAMKHAAAPRREIGIRTVFNLLGPLTNPAGARAQVLGVPSTVLVEKLARSLQRLGCRRAMVVHGADGVDELSITGPTHVVEVDGEETRAYSIHPEEVGLARGSLEELQGGSVVVNAAMLRKVLTGGNGGARRVVLLNAAAAIVVGGAAANLADGVSAAAEAIDSGRALAQLDRLVELSRQL